jgi:hypothetical protein
VGEEGSIEATTRRECEEEEVKSCDVEEGEVGRSRRSSGEVNKSWRGRKDDG